MLTGRWPVSGSRAVVMVLAFVFAGCRESAITEDVEVSGLWERTQPSPEKYADTIPYSMELYSPGYNGGLKSIRGTFNGSIEIQTGYVEGDNLNLYVNRGGVNNVQLDLDVAGGEASGPAYIFPGGDAESEEVQVVYKLVKAVQNQDVDVSGSWSGEWNYTGTGGYDPSPIGLVLQQDGDRIEGSFTLVDADDAGGLETGRGSVSGGAKGTSVVLTLVTPKGERARLDLVVDGEALVGLLIHEGEGGGWPTRLTR